MSTVTGHRAPTLWRQLGETAEMIKVSHSIFALPFALASMALAFVAGSGWAWDAVFWIILASVTARTAAMAQNRLLDASIDARNPRTERRALPAGRVTRSFVLAVVVLSSAVFVFAAAQLNPLCLRLSPVALAVLLLYPYTKRFTSLSHVWLGAALGLAPVGAWVAVRGAFVEMETPLLLSTAVMLWTAGFDLIYSCQDVEIDRREGLCSIPARLGVARALRLSAVFHVVSIALLAAVLAVNPDVGWLYALGVALAGAILIYEHAIVRPDDLSRVNLAFFVLNGLVSLLVGALTITDALL